MVRICFVDSASAIFFRYAIARSVPEEALITNATGVASWKGVAPGDEIGLGAGVEASVVAAWTEHLVSLASITIFRINTDSVRIPQESLCTDTSRSADPLADGGDVGVGAGVLAPVVAAFGIYLILGALMVTISCR